MDADLDYRIYLREELVARCQRNASYSARAMARDLGVSPAFFSQIMSGARLLSASRAADLANNAGWGLRKKRLFIKLVHLQTINDDSLKRQAIVDIKKSLNKRPRAIDKKYHDLNHDEFKIISEWFHFAIVELAGASALPDDSNVVASRLGLSNMVAMQAIERLVRIGLLERANGFLNKSKSNYRMKAMPSAAIRGFHKDHLKKAAAAIELQPLDTRDVSGTTMAINIKKIPRAKALIRQFQDQLSELLETGDKSAVYHFAVQLYRLDQETL